MATRSVITLNLDEERYSTDSNAAFINAKNEAQRTNTYPVVAPEPFNRIGSGLGCGFGPLADYVREQCYALASELGVEAYIYVDSNLTVTLYCCTKTDRAQFVTMLGERLTEIHTWIANASQLWPRIAPVTDTSVNSKSVVG